MAGSSSAWAARFGRDRRPLAARPLLLERQRGRGVGGIPTDLDSLPNPPSRAAHSDEPSESCRELERLNLFEDAQHLQPTKDMGEGEEAAREGHKRDLNLW